MPGGAEYRNGKGSECDLALLEISEILAAAHPLADDDCSVRQALGSVLQNESFQVIVASAWLRLILSRNRNNDVSGDSISISTRGTVHSWNPHRPMKSILERNLPSRKICFRTGQRIVLERRCPAKILRTQVPRRQKNTMAASKSHVAWHTLCNSQLHG